MNTMLRILFWLCPLLLSAYFDPFESDQDLNYYHHVNVITGHLNLSMNDGVVHGPSPFPIIRTYSSTGALEKPKNNENFNLVEKGIHGKDYMTGGWTFFNYVYLLFKIGDKNNHDAYVHDKDGTLIHFNLTNGNTKTSYHGYGQDSITPISGSCSAKNNPKNHYLVIDIHEQTAWLTLADGTKRRFSFVKCVDQSYFAYCLTEETLPNKHKIYYEYGRSQTLTNIVLKNPSGKKVYGWVNIEHFGKSPQLELKLTTSDRKEIRYKTKNHDRRPYIYDVSANCRNHELINFSPSRKGASVRISTMHLAEKEQFMVHYYAPKDQKQEAKFAANSDQIEFQTDRVHYFTSFMGDDAIKRKTLAQFDYYENKLQTTVTEVDGNLIRYHHSDGKMHKIGYYEPTYCLGVPIGYKLHSEIRFQWAGNYLVSKALFDEAGHPLFAKTFRYDQKGNIIEEKLWGNLTGKINSTFTDLNDLFHSAESYTKTHTYNQHHLPLTEKEENGIDYRYTYKQDTNLLTSKLTYFKGAIIQREFYQYDDDNILIEKIVDDGDSKDPNDVYEVSQRLITRYQINSKTGLPDAITELYYDTDTGYEKQLKRIEYTYSDEMRVTDEDIYDADGNFCYTIYTEYDEVGRISKKTSPTGLVNTYVYDEYGNLIDKKEVGERNKFYQYDLANKPISCTEYTPSKIPFKEKIPIVKQYAAIKEYFSSKSTTNEYDDKGRLLSFEDTKNNVTYQTFDRFGNCIMTMLPKLTDETGRSYTPIINFVYDVIGNLTSYDTPANQKTETKYNTYRKPTQETKSDGLTTSYLYSKDGLLLCMTRPDKTQERYKYDCYGNMLEKQLLSVRGELLSKEFWEYAGSLLLTYITPSGLKTTYKYDGAGRKVLENIGGRQKRYYYDSRGNLNKEEINRSSVCYLYNDENWVKEQWEEDSYGNKENHMWFYYDKEGKKTSACRQTASGYAYDYFDYDDEGRVIKHTDPLGYITTTEYDEYFTNSMYQNVFAKIVTDPKGNKTITANDVSDRLVLTEQQNREGQTLAKEEIYYDKAGNKAKTITYAYKNTKLIRTIVMHWEYDEAGNMIKQIEPDGSETLFMYDIMGRCIQKITPSHEIIEQEYDDLGRLLQIKSSDRTVHYTYAYDQGHNPILIKDRITGESIKRKYNEFGELLEETHSNGLSYHWNYDDYGRCICFTLPDKSTVEYSYDDLHMTEVKRTGATHEYEHIYNDFDPNGHVTSEILPFSYTEVSTKRDKLERPIYQSSSVYSHNVGYDAAGLVYSLYTSFFGKKFFNYDDLNQLIQDGEKEYVFDSLGNDVNFTVNDRNQLLNTQEEKFYYDQNGCPITRQKEQDITSYSYDALGRLIHIVHPNGREIRYQYDGLGRLIKKQETTGSFFSGTTAAQIYYLYDQDFEIGSCTASNDIRELKILGLGIAGDIGAAIAIEIGSEVFIPLYDFNGHVLAILNTDLSVKETYEMDRFGRSIDQITKINPWRFSSKRHEEGFVLYKTRFYDPTLGRWLTPDPAGAVESINLYLFVLNSPTNRLDLFGMDSDAFNYTPPSLEGQFYYMHFSMEIPNYDLNFYMPDFGFINSINIDTFVFFTKSVELSFSPEQSSATLFSFFEQIHKDIVKSGPLGLLMTVGNGIHTSPQDQSSRGSEICNNFGHLFPERTLMVALHTDMGASGALANQYAPRDTLLVIQRRQFLEAAIEKLYKICPNMMWVHISHSGDGAIMYRAVEGMTEEHQRILKKHFFFIGLGPQRPFPEAWANKAKNIYSDEDFVTNIFAYQEFLEPKLKQSGIIGRYLNLQIANYTKMLYNTCDIEIVPALTTFKERNGLPDHFWDGKTYQTALKKTLTKFLR